MRTYSRGTAVHRGGRVTPFSGVDRRWPRSGRADRRRTHRRTRDRIAPMDVEGLISSGGLRGLVVRWSRLVRLPRARPRGFSRVRPRRDRPGRYELATRRPRIVCTSYVPTRVLAKCHIRHHSA